MGSNRDGNMIFVSSADGAATYIVNVVGLTKWSLMEAKLIKSTEGSTVA